MMTWMDFLQIMNLLFITLTIVSVWQDKWDKACLYAILMASNQVSILSTQLQPLITK